MNHTEEKVRELVGRQAAEWFVGNRTGVTPAGCEGFATWLKSSPLHVEEYLGIATVDRDLRRACNTARESLEDYLARPAQKEEQVIRPLWWRIIRPGADAPSPARLARVGWAVAAGVLGVAVLLWSDRPVSRRAPAEATSGTLHLQTRHGERLTERLADNSVIELNADTTVIVGYERTERRVTLVRGQADFRVAHEEGRRFRVLAGPAEVIAVGTDFDVRVGQDSAVVTVIEGRVAVGALPRAGVTEEPPPRYTHVSADQQIRVVGQAVPATPSEVDARRATSWLQRQIAFANEPLGEVAAEFNRYAATPIAIDSPALRNLQISGVFASDDTESFVAFLRSLQGVRVEITPTMIRVSAR
jgi:transmembrane sensor